VVVMGRRCGLGRRIEGGTLGSAMVSSASTHSA
jgi:hypothetical protein